MSSITPREFTLKVLGLGTGHPLRVRVFCHDPIMQENLALAMLDNTYHYLKGKLLLNAEHVYLRIVLQNEFKYHKLIDLEVNWSEIRLCLDHPFVIVYSETDLRYHRKAQIYVQRTASKGDPDISSISIVDGSFSPTRSASVLTTKFEKKASIRNQVLILRKSDEQQSEESTKSFEKHKEYLTKNKGISPRTANRSQQQSKIYSNGDAQLPFTFLAKRQADTVLFSPVYLSEHELITRYNNADKKLLSESLWTNYQRGLEGELVLQNPAVLEAEKGVIKEVIGNRLSSMFGGDVNTGLPIRIFKPYSQLEAIANLFCNLSFLHQATKLNDPLEQFKCVIAYAITSIPFGINPWKPFTPYLGETLQGKTSDGSEFFLEHHGHKPFIDSLYIVNQKAKFTVSATIESDSDESANTIVVNFKGIVTVSISGRKFHYTLPSFVNDGFSYKKRTLSLKNNAVFYAPETGLKAIVRFSVGKLNRFEGGVFPVTYAVTVNSKHFEKTLFREGKLAQNETALAKVDGCWFESLSFNSVPFWDHSQPAYKMKMKKDVLPSDWRFREDILWLLYENPKFSLQWKLKLEEAQREFRMRRAKYFEKNKRLFGY